MPGELFVRKNAKALALCWRGTADQLKEIADFCGSDLCEEYPILGFKGVPGTFSIQIRRGLGLSLVHPGDYILKDTEGLLSSLPQRIFEELYESTSVFRLLGEDHEAPDVFPCCASELWRVLVCCDRHEPGSYLVSSCGRIWSFKTNKLLKLCPRWNTGGAGQVYYRVGVHDHTSLVQGIVATHFIGPRPENISGTRNVVRHGPAGPFDNHVSNLQYGTHQENMLDAARARLDGTAA